MSAFNEIIESSEWDQFESRVERNTRTILDILSKNGVSATFFILGWVAERYPQLVKSIYFEGHEVASHGYSHKLIYRQTPEEFQKETRLAKMILEDIIGAPVISYRAASYSITQQSLWALDILSVEGFLYDSSIFPIRHDRYGILQVSRRPFRVKLNSGKELIEFPLSTVRLLGTNLPIAGGGYFRLFPYALTRSAVRRLHRVDNLPLVFYLHPWEFDPDQPVQEVRGLSRFRHYLNLHKTESRFEQLLQDFSFGSLKSVAASLQLDREDSSLLFRH